MNQKENQRFLEELEVRALDKRTRTAYSDAIKMFLRYHQGRTAESLCIEEIKEFQRLFDFI